jgi:hypothetical protein
MISLHQKPRKTSGACVALLAGLAVAAPPAAAQRRGLDAEQVARETHSLALGATGGLELRNVQGDIVVEAGSGPNVSVDVERRSRGRSDADARLGLERVVVRVDHTGDRAIVRTEHPERRGRPPYSVSVTYRVTAPAGTQLTVRSMSGSLSITGIRGLLGAETVSGNVQIRNAGRLAGVRTVSGRIDLAGVETDGGVDAETVSGAVNAERVKAPRISIETVSGAITTREVSAGLVALKTMTGEIAYSGALARTGRYEFQSHSGSIRVLVPAGAGFTVEARTFSGRLEADPALRLSGAASSERQLRGTAGDGTAYVSATTFSGNVTIAPQ